MGNQLFVGKDETIIGSSVTLIPNQTADLTLKAREQKKIELRDEQVDSDLNSYSGVWINSNRLTHDLSQKYVPGDTTYYNQNIRTEVYRATTNILSGLFTINSADELKEVNDPNDAWTNRRHINYFSPEKIQFRKFAECVTMQGPNQGNSNPTEYPELNNNTYAGPNMDIDLYQGSIQHKILTNDVGDVDIIDRKYGPTSTFSTNQLNITEPDPGTSITIIMYHQDTVKTIAWPTDFKFLGDDRELSTVAGVPTTHDINGTDINNIVAIDMLHAFYDGRTWWASITRGYA
jgi:hypothetical protein